MFHSDFLITADPLTPRQWWSQLLLCNQLLQPESPQRTFTTSQMS